MEETAQNVPALREDRLLVEAEKAAAGLVSRLSWLEGALPSLMPAMAEYTTPEFLSQLVAALREDGLLEKTVDGLDAIQTALITIITMRASDLVGQQLARLQAAKTMGTLDTKQTFALQKIMDALTRAMKAAGELKDAAGFSKRARRELGDVRADALQRLLDDVAREDGVPESEDATVFLAGGLVKRPKADDTQFEIVETSPFEQPLSKVEEGELTAAVE